MVQYYVYFGKKLLFNTTFAYWHSAIAALVGIIIFAIIYYLHSKKKIHMQRYLLILLPLLGIIVVFLLLVMLFPIMAPVTK